MLLDDMAERNAFYCAVARLSSDSLGSDNRHVTKPVPDCFLPKHYFALLTRCNFGITD